MQHITDQIAARREDLRAAQIKLESIHGRSRSILAKADREGREVTAEEQRQADALAASFDRAEAEANAIRADIDELEHLPLGRVSTPNPIASSDPMQPRGRHAAGRAASSTERPGRTFTGMFGNAGGDQYNGAFPTLGDFALAVASGNDPRLLRNASIAPSTGEVGTDGGFLVPLGFSQFLMDEALKMEIVRPRAYVVPITSRQAVVAGFDTTDRTGNKRGGLYMYWGNRESQDLTSTKPKARELTVRAHKGAVYVTVSNELAADAPNFDRMLADAMVAATAAGLDHAFINGTGAGQPMGMLGAPATIIVAKESGQAANTLLLQNLANMVGRLSPSSFTRAVWLVHPTLIPVLYQLSYTVKNVAGSENVGGSHVQAIGHDGDGNLVIFGRPCVVTDAVSPLSSQGDISLVDMQRYVVALRQDLRLDRDTSRYFDSDELAFRLTVRCDGMPLDATPTTLRDGTNTVSPFVVLGAR